MAYTDFTLELLESRFGLVTEQVPLFSDIAAVPVPPELQALLQKSIPLALGGGEKARSEFIVAPVLLFVRDLCDNQISVHSGHRLDADPASGLVGECDFILSLSPQTVVVRRPILSVIEAKKSDVDQGLGQCAAQMLGASRFNLQSSDTALLPLYGCVTSGETWQFLRLTQDQIQIDTARYYLDNLGAILDVLLRIVREPMTYS